MSIQTIANTLIAMSIFAYGIVMLGYLYDLEARRDARKAEQERRKRRHIGTW